MHRVLLPKKVKKRDGSIVRFDAKMIERAIEKAALEVFKDKAKARIISRRVADIANRRLATLNKNKTLIINFGKKNNNIFSF